MGGYLGLFQIGFQFGVLEVLVGEQDLHFVVELLQGGQRHLKYF